MTMTTWLKQVGLWISLLGLLILMIAPFSPTAQAQQEPAEKPVAKSVCSQTCRFVVIGDSGANTPFQRDVAKQMLALHQKKPFSLILHVGDIIYPSGDFKNTGESHHLKFYRPLMEKGVQMMPIMGNHDVVFGFDKKALDFYNIPARYYTFSRQNVDFFAIDTNIIDDDEQLIWLRNSLAQSKARWKVVYGHHPVFSSGLHGNSNTLMKKLVPLLKRYHVDLYFAGHDHNYERLGPVDDVLYIISGGGGAYLRNMAEKNPYSKIYVKAHHLTLAEVTRNQIHITAIDKTGKVIDETTLNKPAQ